MVYFVKKNVLINLEVDLNTILFNNDCPNNFNWINLLQ